LIPVGNFVQKKKCKDKEILLDLGKKYIHEAEEEGA
jgi:hypothetical protein